MNSQRSFPATAPSIGAARRFAGDALVGTPADALDDVRLMVSELATNVVEHARSGFRLTVRRTQQKIRVEVTDHGGDTPVMRPIRLDAADGRGLQIVDRLSSHWGVRNGSDAGKTVWFTLELTTPHTDGTVVTLQTRSPLEPEAEGRGTTAQLSALPEPTG